MKKVLGTILIGVFALWIGIRIYKNVSLTIDCTGHLKRAADANTVELAKEELRIAISYLESNQLTTGYTSILYRTPNEDIGFWYKNLKYSLKELEQVTSETMQLEKSNLLMKLRETLLDHGKDGDSVTAPAGISIFPNNTGFAIWGIIGAILALIGYVLISVDED